MNNDTVTPSSKTKLILAILLAGLLISGFVLMSRKNVSLQFEAERTELKTYAPTVEDFLKEQNIQLEEKGYINHPLNTKLENNMEIVIKEPKHYDLVIAKGKIEKDLVSPFTQVGNILESLDVSLGEKDYTEPGLEENIEEGTLIKVFRVEEKVEKKELEIPFETNYKDNSNMLKGESKVISPGSKGLKSQELKTTLVNGETSKVEIVREDVLREATPELVERGTNQLLATSRGSRKFKKTMIMTATAYDDTPQSQGKWVGKTATGLPLQHGMIAVDPRVIPLGTRLYVEGYGEGVAGDTGGAIKGNKIDLFFSSSRDVKNFGRRKVRVYIL